MHNTRDWFQVFSMFSHPPSPTTPRDWPDHVTVKLFSWRVYESKQEQSPMKSSLSVINFENIIKYSYGVGIVTRSVFLRFSPDIFFLIWFLSAITTMVSCQSFIIKKIDWCFTFFMFHIFIYTFYLWSLFMVRLSCEFTITHEARAIHDTYWT